MARKKSPPLRYALVMASLLLSYSLFGSAQSLMTVRSQTHRDRSQPLREMIDLAPRLTPAKHEARPLRRIPLPQGLGMQHQEDAVRQQTMVPFTPLVGTS